MCALQFKAKLLATDLLGAVLQSTAFIENNVAIHHISVQVQYSIYCINVYIVSHPRINYRCDHFSFKAKNTSVL